jgi:hypothetical protein
MASSSRGNTRATPPADPPTDPALQEAALLREALKAKHLPIFTGEILSFTRWRRDLLDFLQFYPTLTEHSKIMVAKMAVQGPAKDHLYSVLDSLDRGEQDQPATIVAFLDLLSQRWPSELEEEAAYRDLKATRQTTSLAEYINRFDRLLLSIKNITDREIRLMFLDGLKEPLRTECAKQMHKSYVEVKTFAEVYAFNMAKFSVAQSATPGDGGQGVEVASREQTKATPAAVATVSSMTFNNKRPPAQANGQGQCFICGSTDHYKAQCPKRHKGRGHNGFGSRIQGSFRGRGRGRFRGGRGGRGGHPKNRNRRF